jgi:hypothetical protein
LELVARIHLLKVLLPAETIPVLEPWLNLLVVAAAASKADLALTAVLGVGAVTTGQLILELEQAGRGVMVVPAITLPQEGVEARVVPEALQQEARERQV